MVNVTIYMAYIRILIGIYSKYDEQMPPKNDPFNNSKKSALCLIFAMLSHQLATRCFRMILISPIFRPPQNLQSIQNPKNILPKQPWWHYDCGSRSHVQTLCDIGLERSCETKIMLDDYLFVQWVKQPHIGTSQLQMCHISSAGLSCQPCGGSTNHEVDEVIHVSQLGWYLANF